MAKKEPSWWRLRQIRHRDAVILAILSASCLLGGQITDNATQCASPPCSISGIYEDYVAPYLNNPPVLVVLILLALLGFTTYFGGIFVLLGGLHFSWGRVGRGRFLLGLGLGVIFRGLAGRWADEVGDRRDLAVRGEPVLGDDVPLVELADLDLEFALAERLAQQVRIGRRDQGLFALVVHLHADRHRRIAATNVRRAYTCF